MCLGLALVSASFTFWRAGSLKSAAFCTFLIITTRCCTNCQCPSTNQSSLVLLICLCLFYSFFFSLCGSLSLAFIQPGHNNLHNSSCQIHVSCLNLEPQFTYLQVWKVWFIFIVRLNRNNLPPIKSNKRLQLTLILRCEHWTQLKVFSSELLEPYIVGHYSVWEIVKDHLRGSGKSHRTGTVKSCWPARLCTKDCERAVNKVLKESSTTSVIKHYSLNAWTCLVRLPLDNY